MTEKKEEIAPEKEEQPEKPLELSIEEQLQTITSERDRLNTELESAKKGLGTAQQTIRQRDASLRHIGELESEVSGLTDLVKMFIAFSAEEKGGSPDEFEEAKATRAEELLKKFEEDKAKKKAEAKLVAEHETRQAEDQQKSRDAESRILALGLTGADEDYRRIYNLVGDALRDPFKWEWVETELAKLEGKSKKEKKTVETEAEMEERIRREILEKSGALKPEGAAPSGAGGTLTLKKIEKMTPGEVDEISKKHGRKTMFQLVQEGVIREK